jgi:stage III sporulation protein SpoIIIAA
MVNSHSINPSDQQLFSNQESPVVDENLISNRMQITDDLQKLLDILPEQIRLSVEQHPQRDSLIEVVMDLGRFPEVRFPGKAEYLCEMPVTQEQLNYCVERVGHFSGDNRAGIERTLHRLVQFVIALVKLLA